MARIYTIVPYSLPATWKIKSDLYKNRILKQECYVQLTNKLKEIDPTAHINKTKKKINTLRSNYRRELKKILMSEKSGAGADDIYLPSVWYFEQLEFLRDHEMQMPGISTMDEESNDPQDVLLENTVRITYYIKIFNVELFIELVNFFFN